MKNEKIYPNVFVLNDAILLCLVDDTELLPAIEVIDYTIVTSGYCYNSRPQPCPKPIVYIM
jgi:hypothetical protein